MPSPSVNIRASSGLAAELAARGTSLNAVALRDLRRYYAALAATTGTLELTDPEWNYLRDILNGTHFDESSIPYLWAEVEDAEPAYSTKWGIDQGSLAARIRGLPWFARLALVDAIERWWRAATRE